MNNNNITQLHNITPEEFKKEILNGFSQLLSEFQKNLGLYDQNTFLTRKPCKSNMLDCKNG